MLVDKSRDDMHSELERWLEALESEGFWNKSYKAYVDLVGAAWEISLVGSKTSGIPTS